MITIEQLIESVDLDFEPRFVTKDEDGSIWIWNIKPVRHVTWHLKQGLNSFHGRFISDRLKLSEFDDKPWTECIYEVPRKTTDNTTKRKPMTSKLVCPFCGEEIKIAGERTTIMSCFNGECCGSGLYGEEAMWQALIQAKQDLEQSEKCCSVWKTQALDYKAETIALSGKLEIARKTSEDIDALLRSRKFDITELSRLNIIQYLVSCTLKSTEHNEYIC